SAIVDLVVFSDVGEVERSPSVRSADKHTPCRAPGHQQVFSLKELRSWTEPQEKDGRLTWRRWGPRRVEPAGQVEESSWTRKDVKAKLPVRWVPEPRGLPARLHC
ncbi:hypothetical protein NDU88_004864, partial [Pleurodeles waltl]